MNQVANTHSLDRGIAGFSGKDLSASLALAEAWAKRRGVELSNYFVQEFNGGRSILVGYPPQDEEVQTLTTD